MKKLAFLLPLLLQCAISQAQLEFIGTFEGNSRLIYLADNEPAIMIYDQSNEHIELYNTDLSLITEFDIPVEYEGSGQYNLYHVSRTLFDCDSTNIEYLISYSSENIAEAYVRILRADGSELLNLPEHVFTDDGTIATIPAVGKSMVEDEDGVVFAFNNTDLADPDAPVTLYRSCGSIPGCAHPCSEDGTVGIWESETEENGLLLYPNPGKDQFAIDYELPQEQGPAILQLVDLRGRVVLERMIGPAMDHILVNTSSVSPGRYEVVVKTSSGELLSASYIELGP